MPLGVSARVPSRISAYALELRSFPALGATPGGAQIFDFPTPAGLARQMRAALNPDGTATAAPPMFAELHLLEGAVATSALDTDARARLVTRLKALQWKLEATEPATGENKLTAGTDDDIFDVINKELGLT